MRNSRKKEMSFANIYHADLARFDLRNSGSMSMEPKIMGLSKRNFHWEIGSDNNAGSKEHHTFGPSFNANGMNDSELNKKKKRKVKKLARVPILQPKSEPYNVVKLIKSLDFREVIKK